MLMTISADATLKNWIYYHLHYLRLADWHIEFNQTVIKINKILLKIKTLRSKLENKIRLKLGAIFSK